MIDFVFTEEQELLREAFAEFVKEDVAPNAAQWDAEDCCPVELMPKMGERGILGIFVPEEYGGVGLGQVERILALEEIARYSAGVVMMVLAQQLGISTILDFGTEQQKQQYLPDLCGGKRICSLVCGEAQDGLHTAKGAMEVKFENDLCIINGKKRLATNSHIADYFIVTISAEEEDGSKAKSSVIIFDKLVPGFTLGQKQSKMGLKGSITGEFTLENVVVPGENIIGKIGDGAQIVAKETSEISCAGMCAICTGILRACVEDSARLAKDKMASEKTSANLQTVQFYLAENRVDYEAAKALLYKAAALKDSGSSVIADFSIAKLFSVEAAMRSVKRTLELMSGYGILKEYPTERYLRDMLSTIPSAGTSEAQKLIIASDTVRQHS